MSLTYEKNPEAIYRASFSTVRAEADLSVLPESLHSVAIRVIHACGMVDLPAGLSFGGDVVDAAREALVRGAPVLCDCEMVRAGISSRRLRNNPVIATLNDERTPDLAKTLRTTRSAAAVELWRDRIDGALVVIGNAPTALFHLLGRLDDGWPKPAAVFAFPVGFVGAAESKAALAADPRGVPYLALLGRRGGSAMAAAA
ncbi:MAG: precorrin-8X methylmutase, partial [Rhodospirillales bacterium]|nr:precorrin-8X methylmutase [Rhodospirillales bacterium]